MQKIITISDVKNFEKNVQITDQDKIKYTFFKIAYNTQDTPSEQYAQFQEFQLAKNSIIGIEYKVKDEYKNIQKFYRPTEQARTSVVPFTEKPKEVNWDVISEGKCRHAFLIEAFKLGLQLNETTVELCNNWAKASMTGKIVLPKWNENKPKIAEDLGFQPEEIM